MTVEQLMQPRYKVVVDYPHSPFTDNQIICLQNVGGYWRYSWAEHDGIEFETESFFKDYPHLFKPMAWWEERDVKDMPEYVKSLVGSEHRIYKVFNQLLHSSYFFCWCGGGHGMVYLIGFVIVRRG